MEAKYHSMLLGTALRVKAKVNRLSFTPAGRALCLCGVSCVADVVVWFEAEPGREDPRLASGLGEGREGSQLFEGSLHLVHEDLPAQDSASEGLINLNLSITCDASSRPSQVLRQAELELRQTELGEIGIESPSPQGFNKNCNKWAQLTLRFLPHFQRWDLSLNRTHPKRWEDGRCNTQGIRDLR